MTWTHDLPKGKMWKGEPFQVAQHKLDGWLCTLFKQRTGDLVAFGKHKEPHLEFLSRFPRLRDHPFVISFRQRAPVFSSVSCEILTEDRFSVPTALKDPKIPLRMIAFAAPYIDGVDMRGESMTTAQLKCHQWGLPFAKWFSMREIFRVPEGDSFEAKGEKAIKVARERLLMLAANEKVEGFMLKMGGQCGKWYKVKPSPTVDCIITGTIAGEGKYRGSIGSIVCSVIDPSLECNCDAAEGACSCQRVEIASASGMTDDERLDMALKHQRDELIGLVVELEYQIVGSQGRLVHPRFKRFRPDKPANQCTIDQIKE